jgi:FkbM family methyltransferase
VLSSRARSFWPGIVRRLDRPGRRGLLALPASAWVSWTYREPCLVYWRGGAWIHHYRQAKIPHATLGRAAPPGVLTADARDLCLYDYSPQAGDVVFDVGAGIGAEALLFSRLVGGRGRVVSIEAHPRTYARLVGLCTVNRLDNVIPLQFAVGDTNGHVLLSDVADHVQNKLLGPGETGIRVPARRIDTIASELGIGQVDLLKMNIEGAERQALSGMGALLERTRHVCISCHDFLGVPTKATVRGFLLEHGFDVHSRDDAPEAWTRDYLYGSRP